ncbi:MAG: hypothetical protein EWV85_14735 [Microcystis aeruginosa Ma_QC_C_20070703_M131]|jgi:hypothetical protein|uniref:Uncharacterized protein n=1 Tax=Microcystis aeruginosa Ma_QC_C_20070703_M131 TaxID=2486263 RepID=A0A551XVY4_MICAE|nr:MAG: hypothetical protein EWV85_14735 [Microcystis aeruginosa Ma_QC_C_20070703_M131]
MISSFIAFLIHKRYIPDPEQLNQQRFNCAAQIREPLYNFLRSVGVKCDFDDNNTKSVEYRLVMRRGTHARGTHA